MPSDRDLPDDLDVDNWLEVRRPGLTHGGVIGSTAGSPPDEAATENASPDPAARDIPPEWENLQIDLLSPEYLDRTAQLFRWAREGRSWDEVKDDVWEMFAPAPPEADDEESNEDADEAADEDGRTSDDESSRGSHC